MNPTLQTSATRGLSRRQCELENPFHECPSDPDRKLGFSQVIKGTTTKAEHLAFLINYRDRSERSQGNA